MPFNVEKALSDGIEKSQIAQHLASTNKFNYDKARADNLTDDQIISHLSKLDISEPMGSAQKSASTLRPTFSSNRKASIDAYKKYLARGGLIGMVTDYITNTAQKVPGTAQDVKQGAELVLSKIMGRDVDLGLPKKAADYIDRLKAEAVSDPRITAAGGGVPVDPRLLRGEPLSPSSMAQFGAGVLTFLPNLARGGIQSVLRGAGVDVPGTEDIPTAQDIVKDWVGPYWNAIRHGDMSGIQRKMLEDPEGVLMDASIFFGAVKGAYTGAEALKIRRNVRKQLKMEAKKQADISKTKAEKAAKPPTSLDEILMDAGVPPESLVQATEMMDRIPAYKRTTTRGYGEPTGETRIARRGEEALATRGETAPVQVKRTIPVNQPVEAGVNWGPPRRKELPPVTTKLLETRIPEPITPERPPIPVMPTEEGPLGQLGLKSTTKQLTEHEKLMEAITRWRREGTPPHTKMADELVPQPTKRKPTIIGEAPIDKAGELLGTAMDRPAPAPPIVRKAPKPVPPDTGIPKFTTMNEAKQWGLKNKNKLDLMKQERARLEKEAERLFEADELDAASIVNTVKEKIDAAISSATPKPKTPKASTSKPKTPKSKIIKKLTEEKGAVTLTSRTATEKKFHKAMANLKKANKAESERQTGIVTNELKSYNDKAAEALGEAIEAKTPKEAQKAMDKAIHHEYFTPEPNSQLSKASVTYIKSGKYEDFLDNVPTIGEAKPKEVRGKARVLEVREEGAYVDLDFAKQFGEFDAEGNYKVTAKDIKPTAQQQLDPSRFMEHADGQFGGELARKIKRPANDTLRAGFVFEADIKSKLADIKDRHKIRSSKDEGKVYDLMRGEQVPTAKPRHKAAAKELSEWADDILNKVNAARNKMGKPEIPRLENYVPFVMKQVWKDRLFGEKSTPEGIMKTLGVPDFINPNQPFNPRALKRTADYEAYKKVRDPFKLMSDYARTSTREIFNSQIIANNKVHAKWLKDIGMTNLSDGLMTYTSEVFAGKAHSIDRIMDSIPIAGKLSRFQYNVVKPALMTAIFPLNLSWNLAVQPSSTVLLIPRVGLTNTIKGLSHFTSGKNSELRQFINSTYTHVVKSASSPEVAAFKETAAAFRKLDKPGKLVTFAERLNYFTKCMERHLTDHAIAAGYYHGKAKGLKGRDLLEYASDVGARTHSMYNKEDLPGLLRSNHLKGAFPLQTFAFEAMNTAYEIAAGKGVFASKAGRTKGGKVVDFSTRMGRMLKWYAGMYVANALATELIGRNPWTPISFIPFGAPISALMGWDVEGGRYDAYKPVIVKAGGEMLNAAFDVIYYDDWTKTHKFILRYTPAGIAMNRIYDTEKMIKQGGAVKDVRGRTQYIVPKSEWTKSYLIGPASTKAGKAKREKHEKDVTLIEKVLGRRAPKKFKGLPGLPQLPALGE